MTASAPKQALTPQQLDLKRAIQDRWEHLEGSAHTAGRLVARFVQQLPPLYRGPRGDRKLLKPGQTLHEGERIVSLETMATGVFKGESGGKVLPCICSRQQGERLIAAIKAAGLITCRRVPTRLGLMTAYRVNVPAILAKDASALSAELAARNASRRALDGGASGCRGIPHGEGTGIPHGEGLGIPHGEGTNSHTQVTPVIRNSHGAERMEGFFEESSASHGRGPPAPVASLPSLDGKPTPLAPPPPEMTFVVRGTKGKPTKLSDLEHTWLKACDRAGFKPAEWTGRDLGAVQQMQRWWAPEFGAFDSFLKAVPSMWRDILPVFAHMTNNPPPLAPCIRFVWANIDTFAHAYREGAFTFVTRIKAPLSKEEKRERNRLIKAGKDSKAATHEVYQRRWPKARGLSQLRLRQDQRRARREEEVQGEAAHAALQERLAAEERAAEAARDEREPQDVFDALPPDQQTWLRSQMGKCGMTLPEVLTTLGYLPAAAA